MIPGVVALARRRSVPPVVTHLSAGDAVDNASGSDLTSGSVTPDSNSYLVVCCRGNGSIAGRTHTFTTSGLSGVGSWTVSAVYSGSSGVGAIIVARAQITGSPGSGTVNWNVSGATVAGRAITIHQVTGHNTSSPERQTGSDTVPFTAVIWRQSVAVASDVLQPTGIFAAVAHADSGSAVFGTPAGTGAVTTDLAPASNRRLTAQAASTHRGSFLTTAALFDFPGNPTDGAMFAIEFNPAP